MESPATAQPISIDIHAMQQTIPMGRTVKVAVDIQVPAGVSPQDYDSYNRDVMRQHILWCMDLGMDFVPFFKQTLEISAEELGAFRTQQVLLDDAHFTVRWMSSQNETTHHRELGYWSWMDGTIQPPVTYKDGAAEAVTVTPSFFNTLGWTDAAARGRRGGTTYLETFKVALQHRPRFIFLHQFNEFTGQQDGHGLGPNNDIYLDTYSVELSDDIEPVSLTAPGYRGDGGYGFYYLNLTRALIDLYRGKADDCTLLAVCHS